MKQFGILLALLILTSASALLWTDLRAKWVPTAATEVEAYYQLPRTVAEATAQGWVAVEGINDLRVTPYCIPNDVHFCILLDDYGYIAGVQIGVLVSDLIESQEEYDLSKSSMVRRKQFFGQDVWTCTFYTVSPDTIQSGGREEWFNLTGTEGAWLETKEEYLEVPRNSSDLDPIWTETSCLDQMGTHFYFNSSKAQSCATLKPLFLTYDNGELHSIGWFLFGSKSLEERPWAEKMPVQLIGLINPTGPTCLYEGIQKYGLLSIHTYFVPEPWKTTCPIAVI